uniref:Uncharacterized protein n=1 Tax=viral metagenome TaxID=1070528 RepID=A0A6C0BCS2_9ZZZZ
MFQDINYKDEIIDDDELNRIVNIHLLQLEERKVKAKEFLEKYGKFYMHDLYNDDRFLFDFSIFYENIKFKSFDKLWKEVRNKLSFLTGLCVYGEPTFSYDIDKYGNYGIVNLLFMVK